MALKQHSAREKTILIASRSPDEIVWKPVADILRGRNYRVIVYEADKVTDMSVPFSVTVKNKKPSLTFQYDGEVVDLRHIDAAWYRRPTLFYRQEVKDKAMQMSLDFERRAIQYALWDIIPEARWLNDPQRIIYAERKLTQMLVANQLGFTIPDTYITNRWECLEALEQQKIIFKSSYGQFFTGDQQKIHFTQLYDKKKIQLSRQHNPFPGFWQPYKDKRQEWRITIIGEKSFDAIVKTNKSAKDDWRYHQFSPKVRFERGTFPESLKKKCYQYLKHFSLRYGAFDFIECNNGDVIFLECNANGQYAWLEQELSFPMSEAIADELGYIANAGPKADGIKIE